MREHMPGKSRHLPQTLHNDNALAAICSPVSCLDCLCMCTDLCDVMRKLFDDGQKPNQANTEGEYSEEEDSEYENPHTQVY